MYCFRNTRGQSSLRDLLNPLVRGVLDDRSLVINTNPIEVYKAWINQTETETGVPRWQYYLLPLQLTSRNVMLCRVVIGCSGLPYDVTPEQALEHKEVRERIQVSVNQLQIATEKFLERILASIDHIPSVTSPSTFSRHIIQGFLAILIYFYL